MGLLKTGRKTLFLRDSSNAYCTRQPLCILDFFVLPHYQRQGIGQAMFQVTQACPFAELAILDSSRVVGRLVKALFDILCADWSALCISVPGQAMAGFEIHWPLRAAFQARQNVRLLCAHAQVFQVTEGESTSSVAYDTPSPKLLAFLKKHYGMLRLATCKKQRGVAFLQTARNLLLSRSSEQAGLAVQMHLSD